MGEEHRGEEHRIIVPGVLEQIPDVCDFVVAAARRAGLNERAVYHCQIAVDEACTNIVEHGYHARGESGDIEVICRDIGNNYTITIRDGSSPFNPLSREGPNPHATLAEREPGGWGIYFIKKMMDEAAYNLENDRNTLTMVKVKTPQTMVQTGRSTHAEAVITATENGVWRISPYGRMDSNTAPDIAALLDSQLDAGRTRLVIDMSGINYISTSGLKVLINAWRRARESQDGNVVLADLSAHVFEVFETVGFDQVFDIYETVDEASRQLGSQAA